MTKLVEQSLSGLKTAIDKIKDKEAKDALQEVHDKLTETYEIRTEAAEHSGSFGTVEADLAAAEKACTLADAAVFKKEQYGKFSLGELFEGWKADPVPDEIAKIARPKVREKLESARLAVQTAFEKLLGYFDKEVEPSPRLTTRLGAMGKSLQSRRDRLDERLRSLDALG